MNLSSDGAINALGGSQTPRPMTTGPLPEEPGQPVDEDVPF
ncbi:MAG: hypothetical protein WC205_02595 [Opitutaceae bacterium]